MPGRLRIVEVESYDWAACGGVHVASTGEIFFVKAVGQERIRGRVRVHVMMGRRALEDYGRKISLVQDLVRELTCGETDVLGRVQELVKNARETARELKRLQVAQAKTDADEALSSAKAMGAALCVRRVFDAAGPEYLKAFAERVIAAPDRVVLAVDRGADGFQWIVAHSLGSPLELSTIITGLLNLAGAKGGGRGARMQGVGSRSEAIPAFLDAVERGAREGKIMKLHIRYNSPVILTFAFLCAIVLLIDQISGGAFIRAFFILPPTFNASSPLSWLKLVTYVIGHASWAHLIGNFSFILLIGPVLEEKYGSIPLLLMMLVTALATAILNILIVRTGLTARAASCSCSSSSAPSPTSARERSPSPSCSSSCSTWCGSS